MTSSQPERRIENFNQLTDLFAQRGESGLSKNAAERQTVLVDVCIWLPTQTAQSLRNGNKSAKGHRKTHQRYSWLLQTGRTKSIWKSAADDHRSGISAQPSGADWLDFWGMWWCSAARAHAGNSPLNLHWNWFQLARTEQPATYVIFIHCSPTDFDLCTRLCWWHVVVCASTIKLLELQLISMRWADYWR